MDLQLAAAQSMADEILAHWRDSPNVIAIKATPLYRIDHSTAQMDVTIVVLKPVNKFIISVLTLDAEGGNINT